MLHLSLPPGKSQFEMELAEIAIGPNEELGAVAFQISLPATARDLQQLEFLFAPAVAIELAGRLIRAALQMENTDGD
jgi:hypothetical protein